MTDERAAELGVRKTPSKNALLAASNVVSVHLVLGDHTRGLLGPRELALLKPSAFVVSTSRATIVDTDALVAALQAFGTPTSTQLPRLARAGRSGLLTLGRRPFHVEVVSATMADYPDDWAKPDLGSAVAALTSAGVEVTASDVGKGVHRIDFVLDGRSCSLVERTPTRRGEWVALEFPWPAAWPDIALTSSGRPDQEEAADPFPPAGHALSSHDLPAARAVVDAGFAPASVDPPADLLVDVFDGASISTDPCVTLNGTTAAWLLNLARLVLAAAPPVDPVDDVVGKVHPDWEDSSGVVRGTRPEVLHRLLWLLRTRHDEDAQDPDVRGPLRQSLDRWIVAAARLAADRRTEALQAAEGREGVRVLVLGIADTLHRAGAGDPAESELADRVRAIVTQAREWDVPASVATTSRPRSAAAPATEPKPPRSWWRRG